MNKFDEMLKKHTSNVCDAVRKSRRLSLIDELAHVTVELTVNYIPTSKTHKLLDELYESGGLYEYNGIHYKITCAEIVIPYEEDEITILRKRYVLESAK